jgi:two-component system sensor histidine kinase YesM
VRANADIQNFRFEGLFDIQFQIDEHALRYWIPKNILQPLVENALTHGIEPKRVHGVITVTAALESGENAVILKVADDGIGMEEERVDAMLAGQVQQTSGSGYAIKNIMERLKGYYGERASFEVSSKPGNGTVITITLPKE